MKINEIREISNNWINNFITNYHNYFPLIIEAFYKYYGIKYLEEIKNKFIMLDFKFILNDFTYALEKNTIQKETIKIKSYLSIVECLLDYERKKGIPEKILIQKRINLYTLKDKDLSKEDYLNLEWIIKKSVIASVYFDNNHIAKGIYLPIYFLNDEILFHELNHVITTPKDKDSIFPYFEVEELFNHRATLDILNYFKLNNVIISNDIKLKYKFTSKLYLIEEFYTKYKDLIKVYLIKHDIRILENNLGKKNIESFFKLVKNLCNKKTVTTSDLKMLGIIMSFMELHYKGKENKNEIKKRLS